MILFTANRKYDSALIHLPDLLTDNIISWGFDHIPDKSLFVDKKNPLLGRVNDAHITLLYDIHSGYKSVVRAVSGEEPFECELGKLAKFRGNSKFDVLTVEVHCEKLHQLHKKLRDSLNCTDNFPVYVPHVTVAFIKKTEGDCFVGDGIFNGEKFLIKEIVFSAKSGIETPITLGEK